MTTSLVIGSAGYVGRAVSEHLALSGCHVIRATRTPGADCDAILASSDVLDRVLEMHRPDQVVVTAQLASAEAGWLLERVDGPRWLVLSSAQLASPVAGPWRAQALLNESIALRRGAVVLRPTMIFGHGRDQNLTRLLRLAARLSMTIQVGGDQLVQPLHVDDLASFVQCHLQDCPPNQSDACFEIGGADRVSISELLDLVEQLAGTRLPRIVLPRAAVAGSARLARLVGLRGDQITRLLVDKVVDISRIRTAFRWQPMSLAVRLEQAAVEAGLA